MSRRFRGLLLGFIAMLVIFPAIMYPIAFLWVRGHVQNKLDLPVEKKQEIMKSDIYREEGISTVEQFDAHYKLLFPSSVPWQEYVSFYLPLLILAILLIGAMLFRRLGIVGGIAYAGANIIIDVAHLAIEQPFYGVAYQYIVAIIAYGCLIWLLLAVLRTRHGTNTIGGDL